MTFWKKSNGLSGNFYEARLAFMMQNTTAENSESKERFPDEFVLGQNALQGHIDDLEGKLSGTETRSRAKRILSKFRGEKELSKDELSVKKAACETYLENLKQPIKSKAQFESALGDIDDFSQNLSLLKGTGIDQVRVDDILASDVSSFFSQKLTRQLEAARDAMTLHEKATNVLRSTGVDHPQLTRQAAAEWKEHEKQLKTDYKTADPEEARLIKEDLKNKTNWINRRVAELMAEARRKEEDADNARFIYTKEAEKLDDDVIHLIRKQIKEGGKSRLNKLTEKFEAKSIRSVGNMLGYEQRLELINLLLEARALRENAVRKYLSNKLDKTKKEFEKLKARKPKRLGEKQERMSAEVIDFFESKILTDPHLLQEGKTIRYPTVKGKTATVNCGSEAAKTVLSGLANTLKSLQKIDYDTEVIEGDREHLKGELQAKFERVKEAVAVLTPERVSALLESYEQKEKERIEALSPAEQKLSWNQLSTSKIYQKGKDAIQSLAGEDFQTKMSEVGALLDRMDEMDPEELIDTKASLDELHQKLAPFTAEKADMTLGLTSKTEVYKASEALHLIRTDFDIDKLHQLLGDNIEGVSDGEFERYKKYTNGAMVFYQRGDEWKILYNKDTIKDDKNFKKQLTHELLHLEFEKDDILSRKWLNLFTKNKNWENIRLAFLEAVGDKTAPDGTKNWKPEHILSEIYAMQNDIFGDSEKYQAIQDAILGAGITEEAMGLPKSLYHGYEGAESASDVMDNAPGDSGDGEEKPAEGSAEQNKRDIEENDREIKRMLSSEYISMIPGGKSLLEVMKDFNDDTAELNDYLGEEPSAYLTDKVSERIKKVKDDLKDMNSKMAEVGENMPNNEINPIRDMWNRSAFLSIDAFLQFGTDIKEWMERRHKRKTADHAARIGSSLFDKMPIPVFGEFGTEAEARAEKAQAEEVDEWKNRLGNKDAWELLDLIEKMATELDPNRDQFKAILRILAEKGRIDWRDENLWIVLTKLQNAVQLVPGDETLLKNPTLLRQKLHQAMGNIWDYDEFLDLDRNNESNYDGGKQKYMAICDKIQDQITDRLNQLLQKHRSGDNVDPQEYEALLEYSIKNGKSYAENVMFHLMVGMAEGLLNADRGLVLDKYLDQWPACQWIYSKAPPLTRNDYIRIAQEEFPDSFKEGKVETDFKDFYWQEVQNDPMTIQRVRKSVSERVWDHDWGRAIACMGDANTAKRFLSGRSGQQQVADTAVENAYVGALQWLEHNAKEPKSTARRDFARQIEWIAMADGIIDWVAYNRGANDINTRGNASIMGAIAREAPVGSHGTWTTGEHRDHIRSFLDFFDPQFFELIRDSKSAQSSPEEQGAKVRDYLLSNPRYAGNEELVKDLSTISHIDHVFDKMDAITMAMVNTAPESTFQAALQYLRGNIGKGKD